MSPIAGFVRLRKHQFGRQQDFGTRVAATRAYPFKGTPTVELNWTDPDVDVGSRDLVAPPYRAAPDVTAGLTDPSLAYNSVPLLMCGFFGGAVAPSTSGTAYTWEHDPASLTVDNVDPFTYEFGDDVVTDWFQLGDGILESVEVSGPEGLGPLTTSMSWRFNNAASSGSTDSPDNPVVPTSPLNVDTAAEMVFLKDGAIYISTTYADLTSGSGGGPSLSAKISDALHSFTLRLSQEVDVKRFANGTQTYDADAYGPGARTIELECTFAKTADTVGIGSESDAWMSDSAINRFVRIVFESKAEADSGIPYSWSVMMPMRYYTRAEGEVGGNTVVVLTGKAFYDPDDMGGVFLSEVVNTLAEADLGIAGS